ncbi:hypothetical protein ACSQ67_023706 [Phaseolus vulgaris]
MHFLKASFPRLSSRCLGFGRFLRLQFGGRLRLQSGLAFGVLAIWGLLRRLTQPINELSSFGLHHQPYGLKCELWSHYVAIAVYVSGDHEYNFLPMHELWNFLSGYILENQDELLDMLEVGAWSQGYFCIPGWSLGDVVVIGFSSIISGDEGTNN